MFQKVELFSTPVSHAMVHFWSVCIFVDSGFNVAVCLRSN